MEQKMYMISDVAKQVKVENHVLRYWEDELELPIKRNKLGHRYYTVEDVNRLKRVKDMKEQGFQLKAIRRALKQEMQEQTRNAEEIPDQTKEIKKENPDKEKKDSNTGDKKGEVAVAPNHTYVIKEEKLSDKEDKSYRLQMLLKNLMVEAIKEGNEEFCEQVKESVLKELDYQFRMQEERDELRENERMKREEEHYKQIDEMIREKVGKKEKRKKHSLF